MMGDLNTGPTNPSNNQSSTENDAMQYGELKPIHYSCIGIAVVIVIINALVIYLFLTRKYLRRKTSNIFLFSLAISELCYGAIAIPLYFACEKNRKKDFCYSYDYVLVFFSYSTVYHILVAIVEKVFAICFTMKHLILFTLSHTIKLSLLVWGVSVVITQVPVWWDYVFISKNDFGKNQTYKKFHFATAFALPLVFSVIMYTMILWKIFRQFSSKAYIRPCMINQRSSNLLKNERKAAMIIVVMLAAFISCWVTWFLLRVNAISRSEELNDLALISRVLDPIFNPLLYTFLKSDFRKALKSLGRRETPRRLISGIPMNGTRTRQCKESRPDQAQNKIDEEELCL